MNQYTQTAQSTFAITSWDETPFDEHEDGSKLSRASIVKSYEGSLSGQGTSEQLASYLPDGSGQFSAVERFRGSLDGRQGTFVLQHTGTFQNGTVQSIWKVVPGSATGDLAGLRGEIVFEAGHAPSYPIKFEYEIQE
ncbi:MAG: DUF3224 domain-containing protein [Planctomycetota bacterium]|nr:DUF3224 domain-containing protein [Planctomycetota bacterium]